VEPDTKHLLRILAHDYEQTTLSLLQDANSAEGRKEKSLFRLILARRLSLMAEMQNMGLSFSPENDWVKILDRFRDHHG
jgi:hypothetical protein